MTVNGWGWSIRNVEQLIQHHSMEYIWIANPLIFKWAAENILSALRFIYLSHLLFCLHTLTQLIPVVCIKCKQNSFFFFPPQTFRSVYHFQFQLIIWAAKLLAWLKDHITIYPWMIIYMLINYKALKMSGIFQSHLKQSMEHCYSSKVYRKLTWIIRQLIKQLVKSYLYLLIKQ